MPIDESARQTAEQIPTLTIRAGPRDGDLWVQRQKEELKALIKVCFVYLCCSQLAYFLFEPMLAYESFPIRPFLLFQYVQMNKQSDNDWFMIEPVNKQGTK